MRLLPVHAGFVLAFATLLIPPAVAQQAVVVDVELHVISFGDYDVNQGTYTMDFYLHLSYENRTAPADFDPKRFEFKNGRAESLDVLSDETAEGRRDIWYRIQANLRSDPQFRDFPYDRQVVGFALEDTNLQVEDLVYRSALVDSGLDEEVQVAGWRIDSAAATVGTKTYRFADGDETYSRFTYDIHLSRPPVAATIRSFLPPLAFVLVAGFSFLLDPAQPVPRLTLGTGMLISAVGFHLSQMVNLPTLSHMTPFDRIMIATYAFIAACIFVTVALAWGEKLHLPARLLRLTNKWGTVGAFALPLALLLLLHTL